MNLLMAREEDYTRCRACGTRFSVVRGSIFEQDPPARPFALGGFCGFFGCLVLGASWFLESLVHFGLGATLGMGAIFFWFRAMKCLRQCREAGGGVCPKCGMENKIRLWAI